MIRLASFYDNPLTGLVKSSQTAARNHATAGRPTRVNRTARPAGVAFTWMHRRAPQSSSGHGQPVRAVEGAAPLERRRQRQTKPQADQRNRQAPKLGKITYYILSHQNN